MSDKLAVSAHRGAQELEQLLACPVCRKALTAGTDAVAETLDCAACGKSYPIVNGIAWLLADEAQPAKPKQARKNQPAQQKRAARKKQEARPKPAAAKQTGGRGKSGDRSGGGR